MKPLFYNLDRSLGYLTVSTNRLMSAYFRKRLSDAGLEITAEQWGVLCQLWNEGGGSQDGLATRLCLEKSSLSRVLDTMERKGLVRRERDPLDARKKILRATPAAGVLQAPCKKVADEVMCEILKDCDPGELEACLKVLGQVQQTIKELSADES
jgi:Transcriptional regulators